MILSTKLYYLQSKGYPFQNNDKSFDVLNFNAFGINVSYVVATLAESFIKIISFFIAVEITNIDIENC